VAAFLRAVSAGQAASSRAAGSGERPNKSLKRTGEQRCCSAWSSRPRFVVGLPPPLSSGVSWLYEVRMMTGRDAAKEVSSAVLAERQDSRGGGSRCRKGRHTGGTSQTMLAGLTPDAV
jgi:hypothetical protein